MGTSYRYGETAPRHAPLKSAVAVAIGDACFLDSADSYTLKPASSYTWQSAISTPSAPTCADTGVALDAGELTNAATGVKISYQFPWGEGALSAAGSATPTAHAGILVSGTPLIPPAPALWTNIYVESAAGSGTYKLWGITTSGAHVIVYSYGAGPAPTGSAVASDATTLTQYQFAQQHVGVAAQKYDGTTAGLNAYGIKDGFLRFDTGGVFSVSIPTAAAFNTDDMVGPVKASGNNLDPQNFIAVAHRTLAVARVVKSSNGVSVSTVLVEFFSQFRGQLVGGNQNG